MCVCVWGGGGSVCVCERERGLVFYATHRETVYVWAHARACESACVVTR